MCRFVLVACGTLMACAPATGELSSRGYLCTNASDCLDGFVCFENVCRQRSSLPDGDGGSGQPSNQIQRNGLLIWLDATNPRSFDGGSDWRDLSGKNTHGRFAEPPVVDGSMVVMNGAAAVQFDWPHTNLSDITVSFWWSHTDARRYQHPMSMGGSGLTNLEFDVNDPDCGARCRTMWVYWNSTGGNKAALPATGRNGNDSDFVDGVVRHYTFTRNVRATKVCRHYVDGVEAEDAVFEGDQLTPLFPGTNNRLAIGGPSFSGKFGGLVIYDRALSDAEVRANYNADRGKFR